MSHHRIALFVIAAALALDFGCGLAYAVFERLPLWHGLYCALANAVTLGGDVSPTRPAAYAVNTVECLTVVPLFAATFSLFTSGLTAVHVRNAEGRIKAHVAAQLDDRLPSAPPPRKLRRPGGAS